jgi:hypothetical protein
MPTRAELHVRWTNVRRQQQYLQFASGYLHAEDRQCVCGYLEYLHHARKYVRLAGRQQLRSAG